MAFSFGGVIGFQFLLSYPERAHSAILLEPYLPREEPAAVQANTDAYLRALAMYQAGDKLGAAQQVHGGRLRPVLPQRRGDDRATGRVAAGRASASTPSSRSTSRRSRTGGSGCREADAMVSPKPQMPVLAAMGLDSEAAMPGFRETQRFLMSWLPQAERLGVMNATHGMQSMNPVAVAPGRARVPAQSTR